MFPFISAASAFGVDDEGRNDDKNDTECFEGRRKCAVVVPALVEDVGDREGDGRSTQETSRTSSDGGVELSIRLFLRYQLLHSVRQWSF